MERNRNLHSPGVGRRRREDVWVLLVDGHVLRPENARPERPPLGLGDDRCRLVPQPVVGIVARIRHCRARGCLRNCRSRRALCTRGEVEYGAGGGGRDKCSGKRRRVVIQRDGADKRPVEDSAEDGVEEKPDDATPDNEADLVEKANGKPDRKPTDGKLVEAEARAEGRVSMHSYLTYIRASGVFCSILTLWLLIQIRVINIGVQVRLPNIC